VTTYSAFENVDDDSDAISDGGGGGETERRRLSCRRCRHCQS
jgi:hypothetical protein